MRLLLVRLLANLVLLPGALYELVVHLPLYAMIGARNLLQARRRTLLLGGALAFVTLLFVFFGALLHGVSDSMVRSATTLITGHVNIGGFYKTTPTDMAAPIVLDREEIRRIAEQATPGLDYVLDRERGFAKVVSDTSSTFAGLTGIHPRQEPRLFKTLTLAPEKDYKAGGTDARKGDLDKLGQPGTIVLFANEAKRLEVEVGDVVTLVNPTLRGVQNSIDLTVVAVCDDIGLLSSFTAFVSWRSVIQLYQAKDDVTGAIQIYLKNIHDADRVMGLLRKALAAKGYQLMDHESGPFWQKIKPASDEDWSGQKLDVTTWDDEVSFLTKIISGVRLVATLLLAILLVIIVIGIINAMWIAVRERTGEIGTLRAIGMARRRVLAMIVAEAGLLGLAAAGAGAVVGAVLALAIDAAHLKVPIAAMRMILLSETFHFRVTAGGGVFAVVLFTLVAVASALWPALRAANLQPVTAIQQVE